MIDCFSNDFQTTSGGLSSQDTIVELASDILSKLPTELNVDEVQVSHLEKERN